MMKLLLGALAFSSSLVMAQDYYSPTNKDLEPLARFPLELKVENNTLSYTLPKELVGTDTKIELTQVQEIDSDGIRKFSGPKGTATCMGTTANPGCVVTHRDLKANWKDAAAANVAKFADNQLQTQAIKIARDFEHSGNEPIGFIGALKAPPAAWKIPGTKGTATAEWTVFWGNTKATITFPETASQDTQTDVVTKVGENVSGKMTFKWSKFHASGTWHNNATGTDGWFDVTFNATLDKFEGFYGVPGQGDEEVGDGAGDSYKAPRNVRSGRISGVKK